MSNVPQSKRDQHLAGSGIELKSDDTQFDVVTWREQVQTLLNNIDANTDEVEAKLDTIIGHVDEIEPKLDSIKTVLDSIDGNTDQIEAKQDAQQVTLNAIDANTDNLETLQTSTNTKLDTVNTNLDSMELKLDSIDANTDNLETLLGTTNGSLANIESYTDGLEGLITSSNTKLDGLQTSLTAIDGNTDNLESLQTSTNTKLDEVKAKQDSQQTALDEIDANTDGLESLHTDTNTKLDSVISELQGTLTVIATFHENIHLGRSFMAHHNSSSLANGSSINAYFETPASNAPHIVFDIHGSGAFDFEVLEAPTVTSATGTAIPVYNKNRDSSTNSGVIDNTGTSNSMSTDVTTTADGTVIIQDFISSGHKSGGSVDFGKEIVLSASTKYVFRLTSRDSSIRAHINLDWYEPN